MKVDLTKMREEGYIQKAPPRNVGLDTMKIRRQEYKDRMLQDEELTMDETDPL